MSTPLSATACLAATTANCENRSIRRTVFVSIIRLGIKPLDFTAKPHLELRYVKSLDQPDSAPPLRSPSQNPRTSLASGLIVPRPVITTRRIWPLSPGTLLRYRCPLRPYLSDRQNCMTIVILFQGRAAAVSAGALFRLRASRVAQEPIVAFRSAKGSEC